MFKKKLKDLRWQFSDHANLNASTICLELEWDVIDRHFNCSVWSRNTPRERSSKARPGTQAQIDICKAYLTDADIAECMAASINPTIWQRAAHNAKNRMVLNPGDCKLYINGKELVVTNASIPTLP